MADSKEQDSIDLIFHILQEHEERFEAIEKRLDDIKKIIEHFGPVVKKLSRSDIEPEIVRPDVPYNILVVDDDPHVVKTFKMILESGGYTVEATSNALDALRKVSRLHFDLVIIDMNLPDTLGDELAERLVSINNKLRIIMITGYSNYKEQLEKIPGITQILMKPVNPEALLSVTRQTLEKR
ncbi:MAG: response regulator [Candidatus Bathyarchaeota archaeon]|nr:response regulator [Candidatus Bathyarchaeota archaeon]